MQDPQAVSEDIHLAAAQKLLDMATEVRHINAARIEVNSYLSLVAEWALVGMAHDQLQLVDGGTPDWDGRWVVRPRGGDRP